MSLSFIYIMFLFHGVSKTFCAENPVYYLELSQKKLISDNVFCASDSLRIAYKIMSVICI